MKAPRNSIRGAFFFRDGTSLRLGELSNKPRRSKMTKFLIPAAALIAVLVATDAAFAAGASSNAPGHKTHGLFGTPGASFNSPGHMYLRAHKMPRGNHPGA